MGFKQGIFLSQATALQGRFGQGMFWQEKTTIATMRTVSGVPTAVAPEEPPILVRE